MRNYNSADVVRRVIEALLASGSRVGSGFVETISLAAVIASNRTASSKHHGNKGH